jgi:hypothetical protein
MTNIFHYNTNVTMVYPNKDDDESTDSFDTNDETPHFSEVARDIQNLTTCHVGSTSMEVRLFRKFFGMSVRVLNILWELIVWDSLRPKGGCPKHLLWALHFMIVYPKQGPGCGVLGGSGGAVNPKTESK